MKAPLTRGYLAKKGGQWRQVKLLDIAIMLYHVHKAAVEEDIGFEDAQRTLANLTGRLNKRVLLDPALIESCLWACVMLDEKVEWSHPHGKTFDEWVKEMLPEDRFNRSYCVIERKD